MSDSSRTVLGYIIRIAAGAYLIYLSFQLFTGMRTTNEWKWYMVLFAVLFLVVAIFLIIVSVRALILYKPEKTEEAETETDETAAGSSGQEGSGETAEASSGQEGSGEAAEAASGQEDSGKPAAEPEQKELPPAAEGKTDIRERLKKLNEADGIEMEDPKE